MPHALLLSLQVAEVVLVGGDFDGHVLYNLQAVGLEAYTLHWVVSHQAHLVDTEVAQHLCTTSPCFSMRWSKGVTVFVSSSRRWAMSFTGWVSCSHSTISTRYCG